MHQHEPDVETTTLRSPKKLDRLLFPFTLFSQIILIYFPHERMLGSLVLFFCVLIPPETCSSCIKLQLFSKTK